MLIRTLGQAAGGRGRAAGRGAAARLRRARPPADDAGAVAVHRGRRDARPHVPRQRDDDLVRQRRRPVALRAAGAAHELAGAAGGRRCSRCSSGRGSTSAAPSCASASSSAPTCRASRPGQFQTSRDGRRVFFIERDSDDGRDAAATSSSSRAQRRRRVGDLGAQRPHRDRRRRPLPGARPRPAQRAEPARPARRRCRASRATACWSASARWRSVDELPPKARRTHRAAAPARRRATRANWPGASGCCSARANLLLLAIGLSATQPAPREQLEPAVRAARLRRLLQPDQPVAGLGGQRQARHGRGAARCCTAAPSLLALRLLWWRDQRQPPRLLAAACAGGGAPHEDRAPPALSRHRARRWCSSRSPSCRCSSSSTSSTSSATSATAATRRCTRRCYSLLLAARAPVRAGADRGADRHDLRAGAPGAVVRVHDPAHRRPRARARAGAAGRPGRWPSALLTFVVGDYVAPLSERAGRRSCRRAAKGGCSARPRRRLAEGPRAARPQGERSYSVNVGAAGADGDAAGHAHLRVRRRRPPAARASPRPAPGRRRRHLAAERRDA